MNVGVDIVDGFQYFASTGEEMGDVEDGCELKVAFTKTQQEERE